MTEEDIKILVVELKRVRPPARMTNVRRGWRQAVVAVANACCSQIHDFDRENFIKVCGAEDESCS